MKFNPWEGWICKDDSYKGEVVYNVSDGWAQTVSVGNKRVEDAFVEDEEHKPKLSVRLEKSVGTSMEFSLEASGYRMDVENYGGGWKVTDIFNPNAKTYDIMNNDQIIVSGQKIGTDKPIQITMGKRAIQSGKAVRTIITLTDSNNKKKTETRYVDDLSLNSDPIYIYAKGSNSYTKTWYKSVDITIGVVDICRFHEPVSMANSKITVTNLSSNRDLKENDFIEGSEMVMVRIWPNSGYYITGKNVVGDMYSEKMKFSDYEKRLSEIRLGYLPEKYRILSLDESDTFAKYTYKLDGTVVSGEIKAKKGQKLELTYEIIDNNHKLKTAEGGFLGIGASNTKATKTITITTDMVVTRSSFGIELK